MILYHSIVEVTLKQPKHWAKLGNKFGIINKYHIKRKSGLLAIINWWWKLDTCGKRDNSLSPTKSKIYKGDVFQKTEK